MKNFSLLKILEIIELQIVTTQVALTMEPQLTGD